MRTGLNVAILLLAAAVAPAPAQTRRTQAAVPRKTTRIPPPAWQRGDPELAAKWQHITGRYIFQRACTSCHTWGPDHLTRRKWGEYLRGFPENHDPDVHAQYSDLTAMFRPGAMVPTAHQRNDALAEFLLSTAPKAARDRRSTTRPYDGLPRVGRPAPDFSVTDTRGRKFSLAGLKGKKHLVLVFSRAHW